MTRRSFGSAHIAELRFTLIAWLTFAPRVARKLTTIILSLKANPARAAEREGGMDKEFKPREGFWLDDESFTTDADRMAALRLCQKARESAIKECRKAAADALAEVI